jgi:hypothetical protein
MKNKSSPRLAAKANRVTVNAPHRYPAYPLHQLNARKTTSLQAPEQLGELPNTEEGIYRILNIGAKVDVTKTKRAGEKDFRASLQLSGHIRLRDSGKPAVSNLARAFRRTLVPIFLLILIVGCLIMLRNVPFNPLIIELLTKVVSLMAKLIGGGSQ